MTNLITGGDMQSNSGKCLSREAGLALVESFYKSGQKQKYFCASHNIAYHVLKYWKQVYSKMNDSNGAKFVPVTVSNAGGVALKVIINANVAIEVNHSSDLSLLKSVIEVCKQCG